jgi:monoamine oxidase
MERLPRELATRFTAAGGAVELDHRLRSIRREPGSGGSKAYLLRFDTAEVRAHRVVLAMPRAALEAVEGILGDSETRAFASTVTTHPAAKLCLCFERPWWRDGRTEGLRSVTDLPIQKAYYFDRGLARDVPAPALLLSYTDGAARATWHAMTADRGLPDDRSPYDSMQRWPEYSPPAALVDQAHEQLRVLHPAVHVPRPYAAAFIDWGWHGAFGAYSLWNVGSRSWEVIPRMTRPLPAEEVYVCGESYSESQGWVEGALETARMVVERLTTSRA